MGSTCKCANRFPDTSRQRHHNYTGSATYDSCIAETCSMQIVRSDRRPTSLRALSALNRSAFPRPALCRASCNTGGAVACPNRDCSVIRDGQGLWNGDFPVLDLQCLPHLSRSKYVCLPSSGSNAHPEICQVRNWQDRPTYLHARAQPSIDTCATFIGACMWGLCARHVHV